jgi:hypothetical protein
MSTMRVAIAALLLAGCHSHGVSSPDEFATAYPQALCALYVRCGNIAAADAARCASNSTDRFTVGEQVAAVAAGRLGFDLDAANACLDRIAASNCNDYVQAATLCAPTFPAALSVGSPCDLYDECIGGICSFSAPATCGGTCVAFTATGATCGSSVTPCDEARDYCDPDTQQCTPIPPVGASCHGVCALGFFCKGYIASINGMPDQPGVCTAFGKEGEACQTAADFHCDLGLSCDGSFHCARLVAAGGPCSDSDGCQAGNYCNGDTGTCTARPDVGGPCSNSGKTQNGGCPSDLQCMAGTCVALASPGGACASGNNCGPYQYCDESLTCQPLVGPGAACTPPSKGNQPCGLVPCDTTSRTCPKSCL